MLYHESQFKNSSDKKRSSKHTFVALFLALVTLLPTLLSCAAEEAETTPAADLSTDTVETVETEETELMPDLPDMDFGGEDFMFLTSNKDDTNGVDWITYDVWVESSTGDVINDAVFERNAYLEDTYNIVMKEFQGVTETLAKKGRDCRCRGIRCRHDQYHSRRQFGTGWVYHQYV